MEGSDGAIQLVREIVDKHPDQYFYPDQYSNESNPRAHYLTTAPEIFSALGDRLTHFVAGIGTSGTVMGTGRRLHELNPAIRVIAVEPEDALHGLEGLKHMASSIVPAIWRPREAVDEVMPMATEEAWDVAERMATLEGLFIGHSAGASVAAAIHIGRTLDRGCLVCILPDRGDRYFTPLKWEKHYEW
jgi:cysteine synthase B